MATGAAPCANHTQTPSYKLQERRRIEETYAASLRKLAGRGFNDSEITDLGYVVGANRLAIEAMGADARQHLSDTVAEDRDID